MEKLNGVIDLGINEKVRRIEPTEAKEINEYTVEDYRALMDGDDYINNAVVDLDIN